MKFYVLHAIKAGQKVHRTAKLAVTDVPEKTTAAVVAKALEDAGKAGAFHESGVAWGNHEIKHDGNLPKNTTGADSVTTLSWDDITGSKTLRRVTLRLAPGDYDQIHLAARRAGVSIQRWCVDQLTDAAHTDNTGA